MHLAELKLFAFKNYDEQSLRFSPGLNSLLGENGSGKTNLLDAIHYLCLTKSAFHHSDQYALQHEAAEWALHGQFVEESGDKHRVSVGQAPGDKKRVRLDKKEYDKVSEHVGRYPCVLISPADTDLVQGGSEERRRYFDSLLCQADRSYLERLIQYNFLLNQRNSLLRTWGLKRQPVDATLLATYSEPLLPLAQAIARQRSTFLADFAPRLAQHYAQLSDGREQVTLHYESAALSPDFEERFYRALDDDLRLQRTTVGIHRDAWDFGIGGYALKREGSQGQQKTYVLALKLAQYEGLHAATGKKPLLLLDDIFDKLDERRIAALLSLIDQGTFGQIFLTDARPERSQSYLNPLQGPRQVFFIRQGQVETAPAEI